MKLNKSQFKQDFLSANLLNIVQKNFDVILVWIAGSTLTGLSDEDSDIDLGVLIADNSTITQTERNEDYFIYKPTGTKVQWIYDTVQDITTLQPYANQRNIGWAQLYYITSPSEEAILYINPQYYSFVEQLIQKRESVAKYSMWLYFQDKKTLIDQILKTGHISKECQVKSLYHLCWAADILLEEPHDIQFLKTLRRIRSHPVTEEDLYRAFNKIYQLSEYFKRFIPEKPILLLKEIDTDARV